LTAAFLIRWRATLVELPDAAARGAFQHYFLNAMLSCLLCRSGTTNGA
jgi:hypothetical protein